MIEFIPFYRFVWDEGVYAPAIISRSKKFTYWETQDMGNGMTRTVATRQNNYLRINLWMVILNFKWESNVKH